MPLSSGHRARRGPGRRRRERPRSGAVGAEVPYGRSPSFHFLIRGPRPRAVIGAGGQVVIVCRGACVCVCVCALCALQGWEERKGGECGGEGEAGGPNFGSGEHLTAAGGGEGGSGRRGGGGGRGGASPSPEKRQREKN